MKEKFLKDLNKKLEVISEEERKDIIDEYSSIIDEKVNHGKTIKEAIEEFGNINELSEEILKAYKINPNYKRENNSDFVKGTEGFISKTAQKLSDITENIVDSFKKQGKEFNMNTVFEIIIKIILILLGLAILKLPFYIVSEIGIQILEIGPFTGIIAFIWKLLIEVIYFAICILLIISIVNQYTTKDKKKINKEKPEIKTQEVDRVRTSSPFGNFLLLLLKIWCFIIIIIPGICFIVGCAIAISVIIYLIIKGISIYGILFFLLGLAGLAGFIIDIVWKLVFVHKKIYVYPIILNIFLVIFGLLLSFDYITNLTFINDIPKGYNMVTNTYEINITEETKLQHFIQTEIDNTLNDQAIRLEITYSDTIYKEVKPVLKERNGQDYLFISHDYENHQVSLKNDYFKQFVNDLSHNEIYNYHKLGEINTKLYLNENTLKWIQK